MLTNLILVGAFDDICPERARLLDASIKITAKVKDFSSAHKKFTEKKTQSAYLHDELTRFEHMTPKELVVYIDSAPEEDVEGNAHRRVR